jgi:hypothetical protein
MSRSFPSDATLAKGFFVTGLVAFLGACGFAAGGCAIDNSINTIQEEVEAGSTTDDVVDTGYLPEEDTDDLDDDGCWFGKWTGAFIDSDGDGDIDTQEMVGVKTVPTFTLISPTAVSVRPGEDIVLEFAVSSYNNCGDMEINKFFFGVYDFTDDSYEWLRPLNDDAVPSYLEDLDNAVTFSPYAAHNMYVTPMGDQLFYEWGDETCWDVYCEPNDMPTQYVTATGERTYRFTWTASEYAPVGRTFDISLTDVGWTDIATGVEIHSDYTPYDQIGLQVTIVE